LSQKERETHEALINKAKSGALELERKLKEGRYALNSDKAVTVLGLKGGSMADVTRKCMTAGVQVYGRPARVSRYLGPHVGLYNLVAVEVGNRIAQRLVIGKCLRVRGARRERGDREHHGCAHPSSPFMS
jgi:hypothetical protein